MKNNFKLFAILTFLSSTVCIHSGQRNVSCSTVSSKKGGWVCSISGNMSILSNIPTNSGLKNTVYSIEDYDTKEIFLASLEQNPRCQSLATFASQCSSELKESFGRLNQILEEKGVTLLIHPQLKLQSAYKLYDNLKILVANMPGDLGMFSNAAFDTIDGIYQPTSWHKKYSELTKIIFDLIEKNKN